MVVIVKSGRDVLRRPWSLNAGLANRGIVRSPTPVPVPCVRIRKHTTVCEHSRDGRRGDGKERHETQHFPCSMLGSEVVVE